MNPASYTDETLEFRVGGELRRAVLRTPARLSACPALLVVLSADRTIPLTQSGAVWVTPSIFIGAGHRMVTFDLPNHGERADHHGEGLVGMAAALAAGVDVFADVQATGRALLDLGSQRGWTDGGIALEGTSRGGLAALHLLAADARINACAIHSPVTHLPKLAEFAALEGNPLVERSCAMALIERLADRPLLIAIGESDPRVGQDHCLAFLGRLTARARQRPPEFFTAPGVSHGPSYPSELGYQTAAGFLLRELASYAKTLPFRRHET